MRYLNPEEKIKCLELFKSDLSIEAIARELQTTQESIKFYKRVFQGEGSLPSPKLGRPFPPSAITPEIQAQLDEYAKKREEENEKIRQQFKDKGIPYLGV